ncbi:MAG TPA: glycoside hydrolase family 43 protein [Humisphaera sp.]
MPHVSEIQIRDPFVVPDPQTGTYHLFGTTDKDCWNTGVGFDTYTSRDLVNWDGPIQSFSLGDGFWATVNCWAPEVHRWRARWYMFASFKSPAACRGTQVLVADRLTDRFTPLAPTPVTPYRWECLDGTLHVDGEGRPWIVYCHEWCQVGDGRVVAHRLADDFTSVVGDPVVLFRASQAPWVRSFRQDRVAMVTDGPFVHRLPGGALAMIWSSYDGRGYCLGQAFSESGEITGPWRHLPTPLLHGGDDGGHGMLFRTFEGQLMLAVHRPNVTPNERAAFLPVAESAEGLALR